jgi:hypothetical membrane protein
MALRSRLSFGIIATIVLWAAFLLLPFMVPGYNFVRETVSLIGEMSSPARVPFAAMLCVLAVCLLIFAWGLRDASIKLGRSTAAAYLTGFMAISSVGVGIFAFPHPLHNVFGLSEFVGYQAPWVLAMTWRREQSMRRVVTFSWWMGILVWCTIVANLGALDFHSWLWQIEKPEYGLIQRALFLTWSGWLVGTSIMLRSNRTITDERVRTVLPVTE